MLTPKQPFLFPLNHYPIALPKTEIRMYGELLCSFQTILSELDLFASTYGGILLPKKNSKHSTKNQYGEFQFINCSLTSEEVEDFKTWSNSKERLFDAALDDLFANSYRISLSWDGKNQCFVASLTTKDEDDPNHNKCLTGRSDNWLEAMALATYKAIVKFEAGTWEQGNSDNSWG